MSNFIEKSSFCFSCHDVLSRRLVGRIRQCLLRLLTDAPEDRSFTKSDFFIIDPSCFSFFFLLFYFLLLSVSPSPSLPISPSPRLPFSRSPFLPFSFLSRRSNILLAFLCVGGLLIFSEVGLLHNRSSLFFFFLFTFCFSQFPHLPISPSPHLPVSPSCPVLNMVDTFFLFSL